ncbi:MAG: succinylglutamate desuccinylase/aspartoacylase family protein [Pseudobacteriovorax sp.]|nr:succinylglutamate desuccinylase/aspartoacylase family protein [Pseudobacteriovorax sp.]
MGRIQSEIETLRSLSSSKILSEIEKDCWLYRGAGQQGITGREIDLLVLALTHGNEVAGLPILVQTLTDVLKKGSKLNIGFCLGNVTAALAGTRFVLSDLNRSFGLEAIQNTEEERARVIGHIMKRSMWAIDLHQTQTTSLEPFFISRFDQKSYNLLRTLSDINFVTYFKPSFSSQGMTTINYHLAHGGFGFGLELGTEGFCQKQVAFGCELLVKMIDAISNPRDKQFCVDDDSKALKVKKIFSANSSYLLRSDLANLTAVKKDEFIGHLDGDEIRAEEDSLVLFPKNSSAMMIRVDRKTEVLRLLQPVGKKIEKFESETVLM